MALEIRKSGCRSCSRIARFPSAHFDAINRQMDENRAVAPKMSLSEPIGSAGLYALAGKSGAKPYRLLGLCLSLAAIAVLAIVYGAFAMGLIFMAYAAALGWTHTHNLLNDLLAGRIDAGAHLELGFAGSILIYTAFGLAVLSLARFRGGRAWRMLIGWQAWAPWKAGRVYWFIAVATLIYSFISNALIATYYPPSKDWFSVPQDNRFSALLLFLAAAVFAPVAEEILFRGWIYTSLRAQFGFWISLVVSSAIFASLHYEETHIYALAVFPIGLALGAMRETTGSLKASISFHAFFNAVAFALAAFNLE